MKILLFGATGSVGNSVLEACCAAPIVDEVRAITRRPLMNTASKLRTFVHQVILFQGQGWIRPVYFTILISHTLLAITIVPLIIITLRRAWLERFDKHRLIARWTLPLWFYVSVTGVIVYFMVYQWYAA